MKEYKFQFDVVRDGGLTVAPDGEENIHTDVFVKISQRGILFVNHIDEELDKEDEEHKNDICYINDATTFLLISTINSAHSMCEIISFINYYKNTDCKNKIVVSEYFVEVLALLFDLVKLFIDEDKIIILNKKTIYKFNTLITHRNHHFLRTLNWHKVEFTKNNNILQFNDIEYIPYIFSLNTLFLFDKVKEIYETHKNEFELFDNIMLVKTKDNKNTTSSHRGMDVVDENIHNILKKNNIKFLTIPYFKNVRHMICVLYHSKNAIFSYGGPCCTNRFFCNPKANVIVLAHTHYRYEYETNNTQEKQDYSHVRKSHLHPVKSLSFLLDFENNINENNVNDILQLIKY
jgi:hypothetical protein